VVSSLVVGIVLDGGREEGVDEGCLSETGLASNLCASDLIDSISWGMRTMIVKAAPRLATILCLSCVSLGPYACPERGRTSGWAAGQHR
jgi:hypothetical protein